MATEESVIRVLLVEDDADDVLLIEDMLEHAGSGTFEVISEDRLESGLDRADSAHVDAVLLDLTLPNSRGLEMFQRFHRAHPSIPIVVLTGLVDEELAVMAVQDGAQDYLVKGQVSDDLLVRSLRYAVERHQLIAECVQRVNREIQMAAEIQREFLPCNAPAMVGFELGGHFHPGREIGGDFYDFIALPEGRIAVAVGDAAGKGVPGAVLIAKAQGVLQA